MPPKTYLITIIERLQHSHRRAIAFLECAEDAELDGRKVFEALEQKRQREFRTRFDHWISGGTNDKWFHGWPNDAEYKQCFTFKWKEKRQNHRFYGFLSHPKPLVDPSFQLCVLAFHSCKKEWETNPSDLNLARSLLQNSEVIRAIMKLFPRPAQRR